MGMPGETAAGAALVIDAEGSTALSTRLQPYGTEGAEALANILSGLFSPMVNRVVENGGLVAEMAGDGLLAVFPGDPSAAVARATNAAQLVLEDLARLLEFETPDGTASLSVRSVVGAGEYEWLVWSFESDNPQNAAFACTGAAVEEAKAGEGLTPGGVVAIGPVAASYLSSDVATHSLTSGYVSIRSTGHPSSASSDIATLADDVEDSVRFFPPEVVGSDLKGEFRDVVAVFVELDPTSASDSATERLLTVLGRHRGYLNQVGRADGTKNGFRTLALWGAPKSREHDVGYALRFVDDLRTELGSKSVRAGITWSTAYTGFIGSAHHEQYTAIGPGVNLAARICDAAEWGEIWVDQDVTTRLDNPWAWTQLGELGFKGFGEPVATYRVTNIPPVRIADRATGDLVGRDRELDHLEDLLAPLWSGRDTGIIAIRGEAGIGKTRLIVALADRLSNRSPEPEWIRAQADEIRTRPLATLRDALVGYFGRPGDEQSGRRLDEYVEQLAASAPEKSEAISQTRGPLGDLLQLMPDVEKAAQLDPKTRFENLVAAVVTLVGAVEVSNPVILHIGDGQWIDSGTAEVLNRVATDQVGKRVAIIVETRSQIPGMQPDHQLDLGPLTETEIAELTAHIVGDAPDTNLVKAIADRSRGNPFFAKQLVEHLLADQSTGRSADLADSRDLSNVPLDLRRLLVARLDELPRAVGHLIQIGSVIGRDIDLDLLQKMAGQDSQFEENVETAIDLRIWSRTDDNHVTFVDLLVRDAAYGMMLHSETRSLHDTVAATVEALPAAGDLRHAEIAHHYDRAGKTDKAADHYLDAGNQAAERYDNQQALAHLDRVIELVDHEDERRYRALRVKHDIHELEGNRSLQEEVIRSLAETSGTSVERSVETAMLEARLLMTLGRYSEAHEIVDKTLPSTTGEHLQKEQGSLTFLLAALARHTGKIDDANSLAAEARELFARSGDELQVAAVDDFAGGLAWEAGDFDRAASLHRSAADIFGAAGRVVSETKALNNLGTVIFATGDYSAAREIHREGANRSKEVGYRMGEGDHVDNMGGTAWAVGDLELARDYYTAALKIRQEMDDAWGVAISKGNLGLVYRSIGMPDEGLALYREALEIDRQIGRRRGEAYDLHGIGLCHLDLQRYNLATEALGQAAAIREELGEGHLANESHVACAVAMKRRGDEEPASELVTRVLEDEGPDFFAGAIETTASWLRCIEVLESNSPEGVAELRQRAREGVMERASRISDPEQRQSYLKRVESHSQLLSG